MKTTVIDREFCRWFKLFTKYGEAGPVLYISDQSDLSAVDFIRFREGHSLDVRRIKANEIDDRVEQHFGTQPKESKGSMSRSPEHHPADSQSDSRVVKLINDIINDGIRQKASDIHFEPNEDYVQCRARIDGVLLNRQQITSEDAPEVISRLKIMSGLDIAEKRRPQDGRIGFKYEHRMVDIRVSIIPTDGGEKAVLRLLDKESLKLDLNTLGFTQELLTLFTERISTPNGIVLVTGPTGSGKTTTLYATLSHLNSPEVNISTVEDPIEYNLQGINQTQVKPGIGVTFSTMLRSLLRQDPNIIMVGEIRDRETLDMAIQASLTGHLVLSTLHTNSAISTLSRLLDMGAEPYLLSSSLRLIVAQRLVRKNCPHCITDSTSDENLVAARKLGLPGGADIKSSQGCSECNQTGFTGRTALYELLPLSDTIKQAVTNGESEQDILNIARREGFTVMSDMATGLISNGITTPVEVLRELSV